MGGLGECLRKDGAGKRFEVGRTGEDARGDTMMGWKAGGKAMAEGEKARRCVRLDIEASRTFGFPGMRRTLHDEGDSG